VIRGVQRTDVVLRESYLDVLDGMHNSQIETVVCQHQGGAPWLRPTGEMDHRSEGPESAIATPRSSS
jgi:acetolactate synthase-1/2/3 large subunit